SIDQAPATIVGKTGLEAAYKGLVDRRFASPSAPEPPSRVAVFGGNGFAYVTWNPPIFQGGSPVVSYSVSPSTGTPTNVPPADLGKDAVGEVARLKDGAELPLRRPGTNRHGPGPAADPSRPRAAERGRRGRARRTTERDRGCGRQERKRPLRAARRRRG